MLTPKPSSEVGAGGGTTELNQMHELNLNDAAAVDSLIELCGSEVPDQQTRSKTIHLINKAKKTQKMINSRRTLDVDENHETIPMAELAKHLTRLVNRDGEVSEFNERVEASSIWVVRGTPKVAGTGPVAQDHPRNVVRAVRPSDSIHVNLHV